MSYPEESELSPVFIIYDKCPICERVGKSLACSKCMKDQKQGFLIYQAGKLPVQASKTNLASLMFISRNLDENLSAFKEKMKEFKKFKSKASAMITSVTAAANIASDINNCKTSIEKLKLVLKHQRLQVEMQKRTLTSMQRASSLTQKRINKLSQKKMKFKEIISSKQTGITNFNQKHTVANEEVMGLKVTHVTLLRQYIFPINEVKEEDYYYGVEEVLKPEGFGDKEKTLLQEELDEIGSNDIFQISVGSSAASAPLDGNYSSYVKWLEENHHASASDPPSSGAVVAGSTDTSSQQPLKGSVLQISAALAHASQMLLVLRKLFSIHLPHKISYRSFCNPNIPPHAFLNAVKLLNCNILSLCLQQGVDNQALHPLHTLRNLQMLTEKLVENKDRQGIFVPDPVVLHSMEQALAIADLSDDDSDEDASLNFGIDSDWQSLESTDFKRSESSGSPAYTSTNAQSSMLSQPAGLVTSAFNWAKGWLSPAAE